MDVRLKSNVIYQGAVLPVGTALSLSDGEASDWVKRGLAEEIRTETVKTETVMESAMTEEAEVTEITQTEKTKKSSGNKRAKK